MDESGAATYQIPFALPQGIAGVTPSLGLSYSSAAGNGQAGMGWGLSGLSQISRCRSTLEQDGEAGRTPDRFCLGGQRLMEVHSALDGVREFRTEIDSKTRIRAYGDHNNPSHFIVEGEDGSVRYYGEKSIEGDVANTVITGNNLKLSWMITSISDNVGAASTSATNHVLFHYDNVAPWQGTYEIVLSEVIYSGNRVEFKWQDRPDNRISYHYGAGSHATQRLDKVFVYNHSNTKIRGYDLDYDTSYVDYEAEDFAVISRLQYLTECGYTGSGSAVCRSPLQFDWYNKPGLSASASQEFTIADRRRPSLPDLYLRQHGHAKRCYVYPCKYGIRGLVNHHLPGKSSG